MVGRVSVCAWVTRRIRGLQHDSENRPVRSGDDAAIQVVLNDLSRTLCGVKRSAHIRAASISDRTGIPSINELVTVQSAIMAWKLHNEPGHPLRDLLVPFDGRTRGAATELKKPVTTRSVAAMNLADAWNASATLRSARTLADAKRQAKALGRASRWHDYSPAVSVDKLRPKKLSQ